MTSFDPLIASFLVGTHIVHFFGISIPVVQVGGGHIVISNGWTMLKSKEAVDRGPEVQKKVNPNDVFRSAFYPLTLPLTVGTWSNRERKSERVESAAKNIVGIHFLLDLRAAVYCLFAFEHGPAIGNDDVSTPDLHDGNGDSKEMNN